MNPSAAEWRPDTDATRGDSLAPGAAASSPHSSPPPQPPTIFQRLLVNNDLATLTLSFVADVPFEVDETSFVCNLTHTLPVVSKRVNALIAQSDELWKAGLKRFMTREAMWREGARKIVAAAAETTEQQQRGSGDNETSGNGNSSTRGTTYAQIGTNRNSERVFVGLQEADMDVDDDDDMDASDEASSSEGLPNTEDASAGSDEGGEEEPVTTLIGKACRALAVDDTPSTCKQLFRQIVSQFLRIRSPIFYMPGPARIGEEFGLHFFEPRYRLLISEVMAPFPVAFRRGDRIQLERSGFHDYPKFIYGNYSPLDRGAPAVIVEVRQCLINPNGTADVLLRPTAYIWIEDLRERPNSGALYDARAIRMTQASAAALERQAAEAEARRMAQEAAMFTAGGADQMLFALLQQLHGGGGLAAESDEDSDDDNNVVEVD